MNPKKIRHTFFILFSLLFTSYLQAEIVTIEGNAADHKSSNIFLLSYSDIYTNTFETISQDEIDDAGNFSLSIDCNQITFVNIRFNFLNIPLYVQPGKNYSLKVLPLAEGQSISINNKTKVPYTFEALDDDDINKLILDFNYEYDLFFADHYEDLQKLAAPPSSHFQRQLRGDSVQLVSSVKSKTQRQLFTSQIKDFEERMDLKFANHKNEYFDVYRNMTFAELYSNIRTKRIELYEKYLKEKENHYDKKEFHSFLKIFYKEYFANYSAKWGDKGLQENIKNGNLDELKRALKKDTFINSEESLEYVLIHALYELQNNRAINQKGIYSLLDQLSEQGRSDYIKQLSGAAKERITKTRKGFPAYDFKLLNEKGDEVQLSNSEGKYVVLNFWADWCKTCKKEMSLVQDLYSKYQKHFDFISISLDENGALLSKFLYNNKDYNWIFLNGNSDPILGESYSVNSLPIFALIDQNGNFINAFSKKPSEGLEKTIYTIYQKKELEQKRQRKVGGK